MTDRVGEKCSGTIFIYDRTGLFGSRGATQYNFSALSFPSGNKRFAMKGIQKLDFSLAFEVETGEFHIVPSRHRMHLIAAVPPHPDSLSRG